MSIWSPICRFPPMPTPSIILSGACIVSVLGASFTRTSTYTPSVSRERRRASERGEYLHTTVQEPYMRTRWAGHWAGLNCNSTCKTNKHSIQKERTTCPDKCYRGGQLNCRTLLGNSAYRTFCSGTCRAHRHTVCTYPHATPGVFRLAVQLQPAVQLLSFGSLWRQGGNCRQQWQALDGRHADVSGLSAGWRADLGSVEIDSPGTGLGLAGLGRWAGYPARTPGASPGVKGENLRLGLYRHAPVGAPACTYIYLGVTWL